MEQACRIHGVNGGPVSNGENPDLRGWFEEAGFATARLHDCHWPCPDVVEIRTVFPLAHLDPDDPANYTFAKTDAYLQGIIDAGATIVFRLGESIETKGTRYHINPPRAARKPLPIGRADRPDRDACRGAACVTHRPIVKHLANHPRPDGYTRQVGATRDVRSLTRQHLRKTPEKSAGLCPYPFPFQIWFDGDAVQARSASRRKRRGS